MTYELVEDKIAFAARHAHRGKEPALRRHVDHRDRARLRKGSVVRVTEDGEIYNVIFRFVARYFFGYTASIEGLLRDLGHRFGELTTIEP